MLSWDQESLQHSTIRGDPRTLSIEIYVVGVQSLARYRRPIAETHVYTFASWLNTGIGNFGAHCLVGTQSIRKLLFRVCNKPPFHARNGPPVWREKSAGGFVYLQ